MTISPIVGRVGSNRRRDIGMYIEQEVDIRDARTKPRIDNPRLPVVMLRMSQVALAIGAYVKEQTLTLESMREELEKFLWHLLPDPESALAREQKELIVEK
ncbi:hypothetical protein F5Y10DRAFT_284444 [Nemania abortiva]|nr:hypothetical protein F5Y10DRAFT_284444 [Nemania abortiva]